MIYKGKGRKEELPNSRFIHCKSWLPRVAEACLVEGGTRFQVGGQAGHRPKELLFSFKSVIAKYRAQGKVVIGQCHDVLKFFDKEVAMAVLYRRGVDPKLCRLWAKMNNTVIHVRTGVGNTQKADIGAVIGQGTIGGAIASQGSLDDGIRGQFQGSQEELRYGSVEMGPLLFQDDLLEGSPGVIEARAANIRVSMVMKEKQLSLNEDKSVCLVWGSRSQQSEIKQELKERPLKCGDVTINVTECDKWLGDYLHSGGLAASVTETIRKRDGKVRGYSERLEGGHGGRLRVRAVPVGVVLPAVPPLQRRQLGGHLQGGGEAGGGPADLVLAPPPEAGPQRPRRKHALGDWDALRGPPHLQGEALPGPAHLQAGGGHPGQEDLGGAEGVQLARAG